MQAPCILLCDSRTSDLPLLTNPRQWLDGHVIRPPSLREGSTSPPSSAAEPMPEIADDTFYEHVFLPTTSQSQLTPSVSVSVSHTHPPPPPVNAAVQPQVN